jgi:hypothetical protein
MKSEEEKRENNLKSKKTQIRTLTHRSLVASVRAEDLAPPQRNSHSCRYYF